MRLQGRECLPGLVYDGCTTAVLVNQSTCHQMVEGLRWRGAKQAACVPSCLQSPRLACPIKEVGEPCAHFHPPSPSTLNPATLGPRHQTSLSDRPKTSIAFQRQLQPGVARTGQHEPCCMHKECRATTSPRVTSWLCVPSGRDTYSACAWQPTC